MRARATKSCGKATPGWPLSCKPANGVSVSTKTANSIRGCLRTRLMGKRQGAGGARGRDLVGGACAGGGRREPALLAVGLPEPGRRAVPGGSVAQRRGGRATVRGPRAGPAGGAGVRPLLGVCEVGAGAPGTVRTGGLLGPRAAGFCDAGAQAAGSAGMGGGDRGADRQAVPTQRGTAGGVGPGRLSAGAVRAVPGGAGASGSGVRGAVRASGQGAAGPERGGGEAAGRRPAGPALGAAAILVEAPPGPDGVRGQAVRGDG